MTSNTLQGLKGQPVGRWEESWSSSILARSRSLYFQGAGFFLSPFYQHFFRFLNELGVETASLVDAFLGKPSLFLGRSLSSFWVLLVTIGKRWNWKEKKMKEMEKEEKEEKKTKAMEKEKKEEKKMKETEKEKKEEKKMKAGWWTLSTSHPTTPQPGSSGMPGTDFILPSLSYYLLTCYHTIHITVAIIL